MDCSAIADHLSPLADGELESEKVESVRAHLDKCPRCKKLLQDHMNIKQFLPQILPFEKAPPGLRSAILERLGSSPVSDFFYAFFARLRAQPFLASAVAVSVFLAVFASVLWVVNSRRLPPLIREVLAHHADYNHPLDVVSADPARIAQELYVRLKRKVPVSDLRAKRCSLVGFSQCPICSRSAVKLKYNRRHSDSPQKVAELSLFVVPVAREREVASLCKPATLREKRIDGETYGYCETGSGRVIFWWDDDAVFLLTSELELPILFDAASEIRRQGNDDEP